MRVLLTGATGFVGSHILDRLRANKIPTSVLMRPSSSKRFIEPHLPEVGVRVVSVWDQENLRQSLPGVTHVIHCAGCTKALRLEEYYAANQAATRCLVEAVNEQPGGIERLVHISSLAAGGPALPEQPAREEDPPHPVSEYGKSKLAGEQEVRDRCKGPFVILRPPAVYGPRDGEFLRLFKTVRAHLLPRVGGGRQALSLVYVKDLAEAAVACLTHPAAAGKIYYVASPEVVTVRRLGDEIVSQAKTWAVPLPLPVGALWPWCYLEEGLARLTGKPRMLNRQKYAELRTPGWVCDPGRLERELGITCATGLERGVGETLAWYRQQGWL